MTTISHSNPEEAYKVSGLSHVVRVETPGTVLYLSGQVSKNRNGEVVGKGDLETQTRQVYQNLGILLKSEGASFQDVVKQNIYTTMPGEIATFRKVRDEFFGKERLPASTYVGVTALADPDFLIEVEFTAVLP